MTVEDYRQALALFRYGLIAEFTHLPAGSPGLYARLREKANADYVIPGTTRTRVAAETLRHWLKEYRRGGFDALLPKGRADRGRSRALPQAVADALMSLKDEQPRLSVPQLIRAVRDSGVAPDSVVLAPATVHRLLSRAGLLHKDPVDPSSKDRRAFAFAHCGAQKVESVVIDGQPALRLQDCGMMTAWSGLCESWWHCSRTLSGSSYSSCVRPRRSVPKT